MDEYRDLSSNVSEINISVISKAAAHLGLDSFELIKESELDLADERTEKVVELFSAVQAATLICGDGGSTAVHDLERLEASGIELAVVSFFEYHPEYHQVHFQGADGFEQGLSFLDALFNVGHVETGKIIRNFDEFR